MFPSRRTARRAVILTAAAAAVGCSSGDSTSTSTPAPKAAMLLVTNSTCAAGHCDSIDVLAFPSYQYPPSPGGLRSIDLGIVATATACLTLPVADTIRVTATDNYGYTTTTAYTWNPLGVLTLGTITPGGSRLSATPSTSGFIPANSPGWSATLPGSQKTAAAACTP